MNNKQQFFVFHNSFEASYLSIIEEIVCKNLELGTAQVIHRPLPQLQTFCNPLHLHKFVVCVHVSI